MTTVGITPGALMAVLVTLFVVFVALYVVRRRK
ncbi:hypothetical protein J2S92_001564 [Arthrobacter bambusae]|nr:hypothetical protein [Arthrobacter bambusae]MDQ0236016.1 hypothetical protein [Arthrobacter bambusae]